jgi:hypothetical protein
MVFPFGPQTPARQTPLLTDAVVQLESSGAVPLGLQVRSPLPQV